MNAMRDPRDPGKPRRSAGARPGRAATGWSFCFPARDSPQAPATGRWLLQPSPHPIPSLQNIPLPFQPPSPHPFPAASLTPQISLEVCLLGGHFLPPPVPSSAQECAFGARWHSSLFSYTLYWALVSPLDCRLLEGRNQAQLVRHPGNNQYVKVREQTGG